MCAGISLSWRELPQVLIEQYCLQERVIVRHEGAEREIRFLSRDRQPLLPAWHANQLEIYGWGGGRSKLPKSGFVEQEAIKAGSWRELSPVEVDVPAAFGFERGIWFQIREGLRGVLVNDERERPHVYLLTQPASHYYQVMTRSPRMPVFIGAQM